VVVGHVRVREHDLIDLVLADQVFELAFGMDRDALGVELTGEERRVDAPGDVRDLRRREGDHLVLLAAAKEDVEVVEVPPGRSCDENSRLHHVYELCIYTSDRPR
jgi:hypothetical protein